MLKEWNAQICPDENELKARLDKARDELSRRQILIREKKLPVLVTFDGWGAAGKGSVLNKVIKNLDPRFFKVQVMSTEPSPDERREPFIYRHFIRIPEQGKFAFFDSSWMKEITSARLSGELHKKTYAQRVNTVRIFERQLHDNGYLLVKFFFQISRKEQKKRLEKLLEDKNTAWRVTKDDLKENRHYDECLDVYDQYISDTSQFEAPWYFIDSENRRWAELQVTETLVRNIDTALANAGSAAPLLQNTYRLINMPKLSEVRLDDKTVDEQEYRKRLDKLQKRLLELHYEIYRRKVPVIIGFEGWDAAGKGGTIKRVTSALDPRGYEVHPTASPEPHEKARHFLWRFYTRLPKDGHIAIFDRTWYGRVMVERLEGFCSENDWQRAYNEINEFEKDLTDWGAVVIKFWLQIDSDTQLQRFRARQQDPEKQWKITDEDWRNRDKWDQYEVAVNEMIAKTSTDFAPWHILEANDKKYARLKALETVISEIEKKLLDEHLL